MAGKTYPPTLLLIWGRFWHAATCVTAAPGLPHKAQRPAKYHLLCLRIRAFIHVWLTPLRKEKSRWTLQF